MHLYPYRFALRIHNIILIINIVPIVYACAIVLLPKCLDGLQNKNSTTVIAKPLSIFRRNQLES